MESWKRKLRMGMVGGGQGAFIGGVHRIAATLDQQVELVAGCFSQSYENTKVTGAQLYLDPPRCYPTYEAMAAAEAKLSGRQANRLRQHRHSECLAFRHRQDISQRRLPRRLRQANDLQPSRRPRNWRGWSEKTGLVFAVTHNYTGHPLVRHARELFRSGAMGTVRKVIVEYLQDFLMVPHEKLGQKQAEWRLDPARSGLGATIGDVGTHCVNLLEYVTGDPIASLCADKSTFLPDRKLDEDVNALLRLKGGGKGVLTISQVATGEENGLTLRVYASEGAIKWEQENPNYLELYRYGEPRQTLTRGQGYLSDAAERYPHPHRPPRGLSRSLRHDLCRRRAGHPRAHRRQALKAGRIRISDRP